MKYALLLLILMLPTSACWAHTLLFDDFDGNELAPNWGHVPSRWQYNVSGGMLNVTALTYPSNPQAPSNFALMASTFTTSMDFRIDVLMGWDGGDAPEGIWFSPLSSGGSGIATFGYRNDSQGRRIIIGAGTLFSATVPDPGPGIHHFTMIRAGGWFDFALDGASLVSFPDTWQTPASVLHFTFGGPFPGQLGPLHVDRVHVTPAPLSVFPVVAVVMSSLRRRSKSSRRAS